jgi:hypothetical protein
MRRDELTASDFNDMLFIRKMLGRGPFRITEQLTEPEDTGIYKCEKIVGEVWKDIPLDELKKRLCDLVDFPTKLRSDLVSFEIRAANTLRVYLVKVDQEKNVGALQEAKQDSSFGKLFGILTAKANSREQLDAARMLAALSSQFNVSREVFLLDLGDGEMAYSLPAHLPDEAHDALTVWALVHIVRERFEAGALPGDMYAALQLGQMIERLKVRPHEPDAQIGKKARSLPAEARRQKTAKAELRRGKIRAAVQKHLNANSKNSLTHARALAAKELKISEKTVLRATPNSENSR